MSNWIPRTTRSGIEYGGTESSYYWNSADNPYAYPNICLANCTCYAYGRLAEAGSTPPIDVAAAIADLGGLPSAWQWQWYPNLSDGWKAYPFVGKPRALAPGDLVIWSDNVNGNSRNHVAVIESVISNRKWMVSESLYTDSTTRNTGNFQLISDWMIANYPSRFFNYRTLDLDAASPSWYGEQWPDYVLLNPDNNVIGKFNFFLKKNSKKRRRVTYA